jgi:hypothetical protein
MKAPIDIPDGLYRRVKARSAIEGRPLRSVAVELFQKWLDNPPAEPAPEDEPPTGEDLAKYPWLGIARRYVSPGASPDMDAIRESIARGWVCESTEKLVPPVARP